MGKQAISLLDKDRPYGTIWGHPQARFEQNGQLFNFNGDPLDESSIEAGLEDGPSDLNDKVSSAQTFLTTILSGGPVSKSAIYREAESNNQSWEDVKNAAAEMGIQSYKKKNTEFWRLGDTE